MKRPTTIAAYYWRHAEEGRAVLAYSVIPGHETEPLLWICRVDGTYVVVDETGPESDTAPWEGFYLEVGGRTPVAEVREQYAAYWAAVLEARRVARAAAQVVSEEALEEV